MYKNLYSKITDALVNDGYIVVYDIDNNFLAKVSPNANTLIVFMSEKFPHEVLPAKKRRFSIAGWFRIDKKS